MRDVFIDQHIAAAWHHDGLDAWCEISGDVALDQLAAGIVTESTPARDRDKDRDTVLQASSARIRRLWGIAALREQLAPQERDPQKLAMLQERAPQIIAAMMTAADDLLTAICERLDDVQTRLRRGLRGTAALQAMSMVTADTQLLLMPDWPLAFGWQGSQAIPAMLETLAYRLDQAEQGNKMAAFARNGERLLADFTRSDAGDRSKRLRALGLLHPWQQAQAAACGLLARWARPAQAKQLGTLANVEEQQLRRTWFDIDQQLSASDRKFHSLQNDLLDIRPYLERHSNQSDNSGRSGQSGRSGRAAQLLQQCDQIIARFPDDSLGADLELQRKVGRQVLADIKQCLGA